MLELVIPAREFFDEEKQEFLTTKPCTLQLEHSLVSLSKWESNWCIPFLDKKEKTTEQIIDYIRCMTITKNVPSDIFVNLPSSSINSIKTYIDAKMTATWFREDPNGGSHSKKIITSEVIYHWMIAQNIPMECQKWHLNRLLTLIRVCGIENNPPKKMSSKESLARRKNLNAARRARLNTKG